MNTFRRHIDGKWIALRESEAKVTRVHFHFAALFVLLLAAPPVWAQGTLQGQMDTVKGNVRLVRGQAPPVLLHKHDVVQPGDEILTDRKSSATIRMPDASTVRIYPESRVVLQSETGNWKEFLHVLLGNMRVHIEKLSGRPNPKSVTTPTAIIAVRGTIFKVAVDKAGETQVGVEEGLVSVANQLHPEDEVMVKAGQAVSVRRGERPSHPQMMERPMHDGLTHDGMMGSTASGMGSMHGGAKSSGQPSGGMSGMGKR